MGPATWHTLQRAGVGFSPQPGVYTFITHQRRPSGPLSWVTGATVGLGPAGQIRQVTSRVNLR